MSRENGRDLLIELESGQEYPSISIYGAITDPHMHPRNFDVLLPHQSSTPNGKAGLELYTRAALHGGISRGAAMPNEFLRYFDPEQPDQTKVEPYFITTIDKLRAFVKDIGTQSHIPMAVIFGVERGGVGLGEGQKGFHTRNINKVFATPEVQNLTKALKIYVGDSTSKETTGGSDIQIPLEYVVPIAKVWYKHNPDKVIVLHVEDEDVEKVLENWPKLIPVHIAHVSSQQELEAKIIAKEEHGIDVTTEATFHHLALTELTREVTGPYGCVKPFLKTEEDRKYLWANKEHIEMFASDCAPHRTIDKVGINGSSMEKPAFGIANHAEYLPYFLLQLVEGNLSERELHDRIVTNPAKRFNMPLISRVTKFILEPVTYKEVSANVKYGCSPLAQPDAPEQPKLSGRLIYIAQAAGGMVVHEGKLGPGANPTYKNLIRA